MPTKPSYLNLSDKEFLAKVKKGKALLKKCFLCGNNCGLDRIKGEIGRCGIGATLKISSFHCHFGEEPPISGTGGSGTVFLSGCPLECKFCQNYPISQYNNGNLYGSKDFAKKLMKLQEYGAHNINFVTPTHQVPQILEGLFEAKKQGLKIPVVYNTGGYDSIACLKLLEGIVDIYLPDFKYADNETAFKFSGIKNYVEVTTKCIKEMHRQTGTLRLDKENVAKRGLLIRHLILPGYIENTLEVFRILKNLKMTDVDISLMGQYYKSFSKDGIPEGILNKSEYKKTIEKVQDLGFSNLYVQTWEDDSDMITVKGC